MRRGVSLDPKSAVNGGGTVTNRRLVSQGQGKAYSSVPSGERGRLGKGGGRGKGRRATPHWDTPYKS